MKSKLDILVERRVLTEKQTIASKVINQYFITQPGRFQFISEVDSNKVVVFSYPNDKEVDIHLTIIIKKLFLCTGVDIAISNQIKNQQVYAGRGFVPLFVEDIFNNYIVFTYKMQIGGSAVLNSMLNDTLMNFLTISGLQIEKTILDYGK